MLTVECLDVQEVTLKQFHIKMNVKKDSEYRGGKTMFLLWEVIGQSTVDTDKVVM